MIARRTFVAGGLAAAAGCGRKRGVGFSGYAFVANEEGQAIAAVDLTAFAVARHIRLDAKPTEVLAGPARKAAYALCGGAGVLYEIATGALDVQRKLPLAAHAASMRLAPDGGSLWAMACEPRSLLRVSLGDFKVAARIPLPAEPGDLDLSPDGQLAAVGSGRGGSIALVDLDAGRVRRTIPAGGVVSRVRFQSDGTQLLAGIADARRVTIFAVPSGEVVTHLPVAVRPENFCFKPDGGQLFVTGAGMDAVVIIYPYRTEVAETVLAGHLPGAMAAVTTDEADYLFVASPASNDVTILNLETHKVVGVVAVGKDPGYIGITPDRQYALVLNRQSGDMAVIRVAAVQRNRAKSAPLFTMIPVGSRPVSLAVRPV